MIFILFLLPHEHIILTGFDVTFPFKGSFFAFKMQESLIRHSPLLDTFVIIYECEQSNILAS